MLDVKLLQQEIKAIKSNSGVTFIRSKTCALLSSWRAEWADSLDDDELSLLLACLGSPNNPSPMDWLIIDSASAKARECSKIDMPASVKTALPCKAQERVSTKWLRQSRKKTGHKKTNDP
jgi:hypothetical protein